MVVVIRFVLIVIIDHKTDHSAAICHSSGVEDTSSLHGCSAMPTGKQFNDLWHYILHNIYQCLPVDTA